MRRTLIATGFLLLSLGLGLGLAPGRVAAQIDYRNLDDDRPVATEDAYPIERYAFEALLPYAFEREADGATHHVAIPELTWGLLRNAQWGVKVPLVARREAGGTDWGVASVRTFALYSLNTEGRWLPALAVRGDVQFPVGTLGGDATRAGVKLIATRSWGRTRLHANASWGVGDEGGLAAAEPVARWSHSVAVDRTLFRQSLLVLGEVQVRRLVADRPVEVNAGLGVRWQWTPTLVLDTGVRRRLRADGPDVGVTLGLSHAFALRGLMPRGPR